MSERVPARHLWLRYEKMKLWRRRGLPFADCSWPDPLGFMVPPAGREAMSPAGSKALVAPQLLSLFGQSPP
jgi:hypothetical protein